MVNSPSALGSGINALSQEYQTIANNLANMNTNGYKRQVNAFSRKLMELTGSGPKSDLTMGSLIPRNSLDFSQGTVARTDRLLDVAIQGRGFLVIETPQGPLYTRNGALQISPQGNLVDLQGRIIAGEGGPIVIPPGISESDINISGDGRISGRGGIQLGALSLVDFGEDQGRLTPAGFNCYKAPAGVNPAPAEDVKVSQGFRENSNVKPVEELVGMISVSRLYEMHMGIMRKQQDNMKILLGVANG